MATQTVSKKVSLAAGATTINLNTVTVTSTIALFVGAVLEHPNIPAGTTVASITSFTAFTMSANATATGSALTIVALNPNEVNMDDIALYGAATVILKWSSDDTLTINDGIIVNVTTNQTKYWKTITVNNGKLKVTNTSTVLGNAITFAMGRGSAATVNALTTTTGLASVEINGNWISLGSGTGLAGQTVVAPFTDYIASIEVETDVAGVYELWTNITGAYGETTETTQGGLSTVSNNNRGKFFVQSEAPSTYVKHFTKGTGSSVNTSRIITMADTTGIVPGASITGTGITANSTVQRIVSATQVEVNITPTTSAGPNTFTFVNPYKAQLSSTLTFGNGTNGNVIPSGRNIRCANIMITDLTPANIMTGVNNLGCSFVLDKGNFVANIALFDESYSNFTQAQSVTITHCGFQVPFLISECYTFNLTSSVFALQSVRRYYSTYWLARDLRTGQALAWSYINNAVITDFSMAVSSNTLFMVANSSITATPACLSLSYTTGATFDKVRFFAIRPFRVYNSAILCSANVLSSTFTNIEAYGLGAINLTISNENYIDGVITSENMFSYTSGIATTLNRVGTNPVTQAKLIDNTKYYFKVRSFHDSNDRNSYFEGRVVSATPYKGGRYAPWQFGAVNTASARNDLYWTRAEPQGATIAWDIYRSTTPNFTARNATTLQVTSATEATVTYADNIAGLLGIPVNGTTYYYVLRKYSSTLTVANCAGVSGQFTLTTSNNFNTARGTVINCTAENGSKFVSCITGNFITSGIVPGMAVSGTGIAAGTKVAEVLNWNSMLLDTNTNAIVNGATLTFGVAVGMLVTGTNIGSNARIVSIDSNTQITLDVAHSGTVSAATASISDITESAEQEVYTQATATAINYCFQSDDQTTTWVKSGITVTAATGGYAPNQMPLVAGTAPTVATDRLVSATTPGTSTMAVAGLTIATQYTASFYVRCDPTLAIPTVSGILGFGTATQVWTATGKWQRISVTFTATATSHNFVITMNTTGQTVYVAGTQVNLGATAIAHIPTTTTAVTLNPASQEIVGMIPFIKGDGGEPSNSGIEIRLASAPSGTHWSEIYIGTTSNFTPSAENMIGSTWDAGTVGFSLTNSNNNTIKNYSQLGCGGRIVNLAYLRGASGNNFINFTYDFNYTPAVPVNAGNLSNNNLFHNWNIKNFRNATATNYPITALNDSSGLTFQNIFMDNYDIAHNTQFANCTLKGVSGGSQVPVVTATTLALGSTTDSLAIAYSAVYDTIFNELYTGNTNGLLHLTFNASAKVSKPYVLTGTALFGNSGRLYFPNIGDAIEITWPHKIIGVNGFRKIRPFLNGLDLGNDATVLFGLKVEVAINTGAGYGSWIRATPDLLNAISVSATTGFYLKIKLTARQFMRVGTVATQFVIGETINGATSGATAIVDEVEAFGTVANTIAISSVVGTFTATENIRSGVTVRAPNVATNTFASGPSFTSYIDGFQLFTTVDQTAKYSLAVKVPCKVIVKNASTGALIQGARVYMLAEAGGLETPGAIIFNNLTDVNGEINFEYDYISNQPVGGKVRKSSEVPYYKSNQISATIGSSGLDLTMFLIPDE